MCFQLEGEVSGKGVINLIKILDLDNNCSECYGDKGKGTSLCWNLRGLELTVKAHFACMHAWATCVCYPRIHTYVLYKVKYYLL